jgi:hypothetical protein
VLRGGGHGGWGDARAPMAKGRRLWSWWRLGGCGARRKHVPRALEAKGSVAEAHLHRAC